MDLDSIWHVEKIGPCGPELIWLYTKRKRHKF